MVQIGSSQHSPSVFILDVDGVMTDGSFHYSVEGKVLKTFGADDSDALSLLAPHMEVRFVTGDSRGFEISKKRIVEDMGWPLDLVSTVRRLEWIRTYYDRRSVVYMGDGILDALVFKGVQYGIAPANANAFAKSSANFVTARAGGDRAVAEACVHLLQHFFGVKSLEDMCGGVSRVAGQWGCECEKS